MADSPVELALRRASSAHLRFDRRRASLDGDMAPELAGTPDSRPPHGQSASPDGTGLRRALAMLETGERINDELYRWTVAPRRTLRPAPRGGA